MNRTIRLENMDGGVLCDITINENRTPFDVQKAIARALKVNANNFSLYSGQEPYHDVTHNKRMLHNVIDESVQAFRVKFTPNANLKKSARDMENSIKQTGTIDASIVFENKANSTLGILFGGLKLGKNKSQKVKRIIQNERKEAKKRQAHQERAIKTLAAARYPTQKKPKNTHRARSYGLFHSENSPRNSVGPEHNRVTKITQHNRGRS